MSDIFVALPPATSGSVIFGKNADRPSSEVQEVISVPQADHPACSKVKTTYIEIPQADHTHAVVLSKPAWAWGAEMGANEHGVCVGCTSVWTKLCQPGDHEERLLGVDLVRLTLERSRTAKEAVTVVTSLLEAHGQGGTTCIVPNFNQWTYDNSFLIADRTEAWVVDTAGKFWAKKQISSGCCNISNTLNIGTDMTSSSPNLPEVATKLGYWSADRSPFNFAEAFSSEFSGITYSTAQAPSVRQAYGKQLLEDLSKGGNFTVSEMFSILRDEKNGICFTGELQTVGSQVSVLSPCGSNIPDCHWFTATPNPCLSVFKPFIFCKNVNIGQITRSPSFRTDDDCRHTLYKAHQKGRSKMESGSDEGNTLATTMRQLEIQCVNDVNEFLQSFDDEKLHDAVELFKDIAESEVKFYN